MPVANEDVESSLRRCLEAEGYSLSRRKTFGEAGVDIEATKQGVTFHIEVIGYKSAGAMRAKDFYEAIFKALARLDNGATHCVVAQSKNAMKGLPARAAQRRIAWRRIGEVFPELELWFVDLEGPSYMRTTWLQWLEPPRERDSA